MESTLFFISPVIISKSSKAVFVFSSHWWQTAFLQFGCRRVKKIAGVQRDAIPLAQVFQ